MSCSGLHFGFRLRSGSVELLSESIPEPNRRVHPGPKRGTLRSGILPRPCCLPPRPRPDDTGKGGASNGGNPSPAPISTGRWPSASRSSPGPASACPTCPGSRRWGRSVFRTLRANLAPLHTQHLRRQKSRRLDAPGTPQADPLHRAGTLTHPAHDAAKGVPRRTSALPSGRTTSPFQRWVLGIGAGLSPAAHKR